MSSPTKAFTVAYPRISSILQSKATIGAAFDPQKSPPPTAVEFDAIWDTGAEATAISQNVVQKCGLKPTGVTKVSTAGGEKFMHTYLVSLGLPNSVAFPAVRVTEADMGGTDMLIGMDVIGAGDFSVSNFQGKTVFSYRIPSAAKTDFVEEVRQYNKKVMAKTGRNDPCVCGSGKKFKKCCGVG